jgi:Ca2+-binding RTX toxin-like protein
MVQMIRSDLDFILAQIKIAEADAAGEPILGTLIPNPELPWGLRRVDGSNNNLLPGQSSFGSADQAFLTQLYGAPVSESDDGMRFGPPRLDGGGNPLPGFEGGTLPNGVVVPPGYAAGVNFLANNNYGNHSPNNPAIVDPRAIQPGDVVDADPRLISNLVVDQTLNNPAAVYKALRDAGLEDDPTTANHEVMDAVNQIVSAVADLKAARTAANATTTTSAYAQAVTALDELETLAIAADTATSIAGALGANTPVVASDVTALANAKASVDALLAKAEQVLSILNGAGVNAPAADKIAAQNYIDTVSFTKSQLDSIEIAVGETVSVAENLSAFAAQTAGNRLDTDAITLGSQIDASLVTISGASATAISTLTAREAAVRDLVEQYGIATDNTPGNTDILKETLFIGNVAPDAGLSSPFNGWMTLFGQFFDHGLDLVAKGGFGTVYIPLQPDDPLYVPGSSTNFMAVTRATLDENGKAVNKVTPFVDQNQTYTSNASHQFFLREYELDSSGRPVATGHLLDGAAGGLATWADVKAQALNVLGIELNDFNIHSVPEIIVDPYGNFVPGANGFPQLVRSFGPLVAVEGNLATPVRTADGQVSTGHAFLDDIAHNANPGQFDADAGPGVNMQNEVADSGASESGVDNISVASHVQATGTYDNELLDRHFITGDGRGNENIGLTAVHHVFHAEHNRQADLIENLILGEAQAAAAASAAAATAAAAAPTDAALQAAAVRAAADAAEKLNFLNEWLDAPLTAADVATATVDSVDWNGERIFQAAKFPTEMQYQHLVFEEFARTVQPFVNVFNDYNAQLDAGILAEFAHTVYRFGHSMLTETVDRLTVDNQQTIGTGGVEGAANIGLIEAFLNPVEFTANGMSAEQAAGAIARGMTRQLGNEIDEFVTEALRNNLVGLPLDLAAINIARGRETNVPTLNEARTQFYAGSADTQVKPYGSWAEFAHNLKNPASVINFIAAYGTHETITDPVVDLTSPTGFRDKTMLEKRDAATALVLGGAGAPADRIAFLQATGDWSVDNGNTSLGGLNKVDFWIGGLAEKQMAFGGMLGTTFNFVFEVQLENLQNADRFYYLSRLANLNLTAQLENNKFAEMIERTTDAKHLPGNVFKKMDYQLEVDQTQQLGADPEGIANGLDPFLGSINGDTKVVRVDPNDPTNTNYLQFIGGEHVVLGGTEQNDTLVADEGDDTLWGDGGDDRLEGGIGNDFIFGGDGNDIVTDQFGDDEIRSGAGDDVVSAGQGLNLIITDTGRDFVWAGDDLDEILLGQGDDFGAGGADEDMIIGGEGNDWIESGLDNGLLLGDNGDLIQGLPIKRSVDSPVLGNDVLVSTGGNADFDAESGDDIMVGGLGTDRFFGAFGFDWATYKNDPYGVEADMANRQFAPPQIAASPGVILDRYEQTEALSGSQHTDFLRGDDNADLRVGLAPGQTTFSPTTLDNALKDFNVDLIIGLRDFLAPANPASTNSVDEAGENLFSTGNILLGGGGSDIIEGRGGNDIIDGNRWLDVQIKVTPSNGDPVYFVNGMGEIQEKLFSGELKVADLEIVRSIKETGVATDVDVAQYSARRADYLVEGLDNMAVGGPLAGSSGFAADMDGDGFVSVRHIERDPVTGDIVLGGPDPLDDNAGGLDGTDRLKNIERLLFSDITIKANDHANSIATGKVNISELTPGVLTASLTGATGGDVADVDGFDAASVSFIWQVELQPGSGVWTNLNRITADEFSPVTGPTFTPTGAEVGLNVRAIARFKDNAGAVETVVSDPISGPVLGAGRPVFNEELAVLGPDLVGTVVDGATLPARTFGILEDSGAFTFTMGDLWLVRAEMGGIDPAFPTGSTLARDTDTPSDELTIVPGTLTVRERDGVGTVGTVVPLDSAPWLNLDGSPNLAKQFVFTPAPNFEGTAAFEFDMTDGVNEAVPAEATLDILGVNDAPVAGTNTGNLAQVTAGTTFTFTEADLIGNATDVDGDQIRLFRDPDPTLIGADQFVQLDDPAQGTIVRNADGSFTFTAAPDAFGPVVLNYSIEDGIAIVATTATFTQGRLFNGGAGANTVTGTTAGDLLDGNGGADVLSGDAGTDTLDGGAGTDTLNGGGDNDVLDGGANGDVVNGDAGDDQITYNVRNGGGVNNFNGGRDIIDGGADADTVTVNGNAQTETFRVYTRAEAIIAGFAAGLAAGTEIVISRQVGAAAEIVITELDNVEELVINTHEVSQTGGPVGGTAGTDTIQVIGDFTSTSLNFNTIRIGGAGVVDITGLDSSHRIVVQAQGSLNIIGTLRPQDVIVLPDGVDPATVQTSTANGVTTLTTTVGEITFTGATSHILGADDDVPEDTQSGSGASDDDDDVASNDDDSDGDGASTGSGSGSTTGSGATSGSGSQSINIPGVVFIGTTGNDAAFGGQGNDQLAGQSGDDTMFGGDGADSMLGGDGADRVFGEAGDDMLLAGAGSDLIDAGAGNDRIWGEQGRDVVTGGAGNDVIYATAGDGDDVYDGGDGVDTVDYSAIGSKLVVDLVAGEAKSIGADSSGEDVLRNIENVVGGSNDDTIYASNARNVLEGGGGRDTFVFRTAASADGDRIEGFAAGDIVKLSDIFGSISNASFVDNGTFSAAGQIRLVVDNGDTRIEGNTDADDQAEFSILVTDYLVRKADII